MPSSWYRTMKSVWSVIARFNGRMIHDSVRESRRAPASAAAAGAGGKRSMPGDPASVALARRAVPGHRQRLAARAHTWCLLPALQSFRGLLRHDLRVLAYHRVRETGPGFAFDPGLVSASPAQFHRQMEHVRDRFHPVSCREVVAALEGGAALPRDAVLVTFDDGYDDNHGVAFPILRGLGVPATFFVATGHIDSGLPYAYDWLAHLVLTMEGERLRLPGL